MVKFLFGSFFDRINEFLTGVMTELTFLAILISGLIFCVFSLVFGGDDGDYDGSVDVDGGDAGDGHDGHGPRMLSIRGLSLLAVGFGSVGFLAFRYTGKVLVASIAGLFAGWVLAFLGVLMFRLLISHQSNSLMEDSALVGATGMVVVSIPTNGYGEVTLNVRGQQLSRAATSQGGAIQQGTLIRVLNYAGGTVVVESASAATTVH